VKDLAGKNAVVTGAASGIGFALASRALALGMRVVMADIEEATLHEATRDATDRFGGESRAVVADVSLVEDLMHLKEEAESLFGPTDILFNNAGVTIGPRRSWEVSLDDWRWLLDVNLWGVIYGLHTFVPDMIARNSGYVVNTASMAGLLPSSSMAPYAASKHAVVGISESMFRDLEAMGSKVRVSVLCAGPVETRLFGAARNRPSRYGDGSAGPSISDLDLPSQMLPAEVSNIVFDAIAEDRFWILTHPDLYEQAIRLRGLGVATQRNPDGDSADPLLRDIPGEEAI
jgi:NAD(P)-dependent dehydrogenase (short-subunit alcohol dehydrogenase family)